MLTIHNTDVYRSLPTLHDTQHWYVIHCNYGKERAASETLRSTLGVNIYLPEKKVWRKGQPGFVPFFPSYFFIQANLQETSLSQINASPGVVRLLRCEGIPQEVPSHVIEVLRAEISELNEHHSASNQGFRLGDTLHMMEGPLRGLECIFMGPTTPSERVQVLLNFLGRQMKVDVEVDMLENRLEHAGHEKVRYTRGKGRKIRT